MHLTAEQFLRIVFWQKHNLYGTTAFITFSSSFVVGAFVNFIIFSFQHCDRLDLFFLYCTTIFLYINCFSFEPHFSTTAEEKKTFQLFWILFARTSIVFPVYYFDVLIHQLHVAKTWQIRNEKQILFVFAPAFSSLIKLVLEVAVTQHEKPRSWVKIQSYKTFLLYFFGKNLFEFTFAQNSWPTNVQWCPC